MTNYELWRIWKKPRYRWSIVDKIWVRVFLPDHMLSRRSEFPFLLHNQ